LQKVKCIEKIVIINKIHGFLVELE